MSQAGRTRYFARSATRARSARRGKEKNKAMETVLTPHFYCNADASRQTGDNFRTIMDRVLIGSFDITAGS